MKISKRHKAWRLECAKRAVDAPWYFLFYEWSWPDIYQTISIRYERMNEPIGDTTHCICVDTGMFFVYIYAPNAGYN